MSVIESQDVNEFKNAMAVCRATGHIDDERLRKAIELIPLKRVLFLADTVNINSSSLTTLAKEYRATIKLSESVQVVSSDFAFSGVYRSDETDVSDVMLDHRDKLAVPKLMFDLIAARALICWCSQPATKRSPTPIKATKACGLPSTDPAVGGKFLRRVWKLLNSSNNRAVAYLHGESGGSPPEMVGFWQAAAKLAVATQEEKSGAYQKGIEAGNMAPKNQRSYAERKGPFVGEMEVALLFSGTTLGAIRVQRKGNGITI